MLPQGLLKEVDNYVNGRGSTLSPGEPGAERDTFIHAHPDIQRDRMTRKVYALGLALAEECPENDCKVYLNIFNMARELGPFSFGGSPVVSHASQHSLQESLSQCSGVTGGQCSAMMSAICSAVVPGALMISRPVISASPP